MANSIQLTESQKAAIDSFRAFLSGRKQVFMLKGAAGTGKTTIMKEFLKIIEEQKHPVELMASTGRAAYIMGIKTGTEAKTVHRSIYSLADLISTSQNKEEEDDGGIHARFALKANNSPLQTVYIIDESSMLSDAYSHSEAFSFGSGKLLTDLFEFARGRKIVFVGDYAQLPPVGMNFSPALDKDYIVQTFSCDVSEFVLREVFRQAHDSVILSNASKIRNGIETKNFIEFKLDDGIDSFSENDQLLQPYFRLYESKPGINAAVIAYSNQQALQYNLAIRQHYYGANPPRLRAGDLLQIAGNNYANEIELFNGNIVQVEACADDSEVETRTVRLKTGKDREESVCLKFRKTTLRFGVGGKPVSVNVTLLDNFLDDPRGSLDGIVKRALIVDFEKRLPDRIRNRLYDIKKALRTKCEITGELKDLQSDYLMRLRGDRYYNAVIAKYGYAMTCHKAQGGEWDNVFVDMCRFGGTANEDYFRWAYTALTRATKRVWRFRAPDFTYISNIVVEQIERSNNLKVSIYAGESDFCSGRFGRIKEHAGRKGLSVTEDKSIPYQHRIYFSDAEGEQAVFSLWYNTKGYSNKDVLQNCSSEQFAIMCKNIIDESFAPGSVPFAAPDRPFAEKLTNFIKSLLDELGIQLLNITQERYHDVFHLKTDGTAKIELYYTDKGNYTYMRLQSSLGTEDSKLEELRKRFI